MHSKNKPFTNINEIIDNTIEGILIIKDGFIEHVNKSLMDILCYEDEDELIGNLAIGILIPTSKEKFIEYNSKIFQEISLLNKNADIIPAIIKIKDININNTSYKMVSILDLSEFKKNEKILLEQSKLAAMGEMVSIIAHQWRQPLSAIGSIITTLKLKYNLKKIDLNTYDEKLTQINNYIQYMSNTIDHFSDFLIRDSKKELVKIEQIVNSTYDLIKNSFDTFGIKVIINPSESLGNIYLYKNDLIQIVLNILNNAKDSFVLNKVVSPQIRISFSQIESFQIIEIEDNAGGIDLNVIDKIFNPYFSTKDKKNGTGLGLYICKMIVEKHLNGQISVKNIENGALFTIKIAV
ncbi:MAG: HAMP domain-containing sensor histidine kinase [Aliarcobacter sp.]|nr:HAMP domain-containing sensor histidine kinase [Aliarcobacter sp.]